MDKKVLIDTSAWIESFRKRGPEALKAFLLEAIEKDQVITAPVILLEVLQGCQTEEEFNRLRSRFECLETSSLAELEWEKVYRLGFQLRRKGLTVPTVDILIAALCEQNDYRLLHHDRHFRMMAKHMNLRALDFLGS